MPLLEECEALEPDLEHSAFSRHTTLDKLIGVKNESPKPDYSFQQEVIQEFKIRHGKNQKSPKRENRELAFYGATGTGKTRIGADCLLAGNTGVWFAHTEELRNQALEAIREACTRAGETPETASIVSVSTPAAAEKWVQEQRNANPPIKYAILSIGELGRETEQQQQKLQILLNHLRPEVAVCDEAHHCQQGLEADKEVPGGTFDRVSSATLTAGATLLHLSATPVRHNVKVGEKFETRELALGQVIGSLGISEAIRRGLLAEVSLARQNDMRSVPRGGRSTLSPQEASSLMAGLIAQPSGEEKELLKEMSRVHPQLPEKHRLLYFMDRSQLSLGNSTEEKLDLTRDSTCTKAFQEAGGNRRIVTGSLSGSHARLSICDPSVKKGELQTRDVDRDELKKMFERGEIDALLNYGVLTEGVDLPMASMLIINRDTKSSKLSTQILGRILRSFMGAKKQALVIDPVHMFAEREIIDLVTHLPKSGKKGKKLEEIVSGAASPSQSKHFQLEQLIQHIVGSPAQEKNPLPALALTEEVLGVILDRRPDSKTSAKALAKVLHHMEHSENLTSSEVSNVTTQVFGERRKIANYLASWQASQGTADRAHLEGIFNNPMLDQFVDFALECENLPSSEYDKVVVDCVKDLCSPNSQWLDKRQEYRQAQRMQQHPELALGGLFLQLQSCDILQDSPENRNLIIQQIENIKTNQDPSPEYLLEIYQSLRRKNPDRTVVHRLQRQENGRYSCPGCHTTLSNRSSSGRLDSCEHCTSMVIYG
jgi:superfamily II DNA or RNA helicase